MAYTASLTASAEADAYAAFERIREVAPASAARWPMILEADELGRELRHLLSGRRTGL